MTSFRVAVAQLELIPLDVPHNASLAAESIHKAAATEARLVVLPELANLGYIETWNADFSRRYYDSAELADTSHYVEEILKASASTGVHVVVGVAERDPKISGLLHNTALLITPDGFKHRYRKTHLPLEEKRYFSEGTAIDCVDIDVARVGLLVCADNSFPEVARLLALSGAELLAIPYAASQKHNRDLYVHLACTRAYENQVFVACAHQCGSSGSTVFAGTSAIAGPDGSILARIDDRPGLAVAEIEPDLLIAERLRQTRFRDRRPHLYRGLCSS